MNPVHAADLVLQILKMLVEQEDLKTPNTNRTLNRTLLKSVHHTRLLLHLAARRQVISQRNSGSGIRLLSSVNS